MERNKSHQLYHYVEALASRPELASDLGLIVGYSVAMSLLEFEPKRYGEELKVFKEIKAIYQGLDTLSKEITPETVYEDIARLKLGVNRKLSEALTNPGSKKKKSNLLLRLMDSAKSKRVPIEEFLGQLGTEISARSIRMGLLTTALDRTYHENYRLVERALSK